METKTNQMAADLHLIATPFRLAWQFIKLTLFLLSLPLVCGAGLLSYAFHGQLDPFQSFMTWAHAHPASWLTYPFYAIVGLLALAGKMVLVVGHDVGGMFAMLSDLAPMLVAAITALAAAWWYVIVRAFYDAHDGRKPSVERGFYLGALGFIIAFVIALYASEATKLVSVETESGAAVIFSLGTLTLASPSLLYVLSRMFKRQRQEATDTF